MVTGCASKVWMTLSRDKITTVQQGAEIRNASLIIVTFETSPEADALERVFSNKETTTKHNHSEITVNNICIQRCFDCMLSVTTFDTQDPKVNYNQEFCRVDIFLSCLGSQKLTTFSPPRQKNNRPGLLPHKYCTHCGRHRSAQQFRDRLTLCAS